MSSLGRMKLITYYLNKNKYSITKRYLVHRIDCRTPTDEENRLDLGEFESFAEARREADKYCDDVDICRSCSKKEAQETI